MGKVFKPANGMLEAADTAVKNFKGMHINPEISGETAGKIQGPAFNPEISGDGYRREDLPYTNPDHDDIIDRIKNGEIPFPTNQTPVQRSPIDGMPIYGPSSDGLPDGLNPGLRDPMPIGHTTPDQFPDGLNPGQRDPMPGATPDRPGLKLPDDIKPGNVLPRPFPRDPSASPYYPEINIPDGLRPDDSFKPGIQRSPIDGMPIYIAPDNHDLDPGFCIEAPDPSNGYECPHPGCTVEHKRPSLEIDGNKGKLLEQSGISSIESTEEKDGGLELL